MASLQLSFLGKIFDNPFVLPSGIIQELPDHQRALDVQIAVVLKTLTKNPREGNPLPRIAKYDHGVINSVGLRNPGIIKGLLQAKELLEKNPDKHIIISLFSTKVEEFAELVTKAAVINPEFIELNLSCPNTEDELGQSLGMEEGAAFKVVEAAKKVSGKIPLIAKLSPNVGNVVAIAKSCEQAGVDAISAINTVGPGMIIDIKRKKPTLGAKKGGVSGAGIFPVALRCVYEIFEAVKIPIIGLGGVTSWQDTIAMHLAGATLVGIGTATYFKGLVLYSQLKEEIVNYLQQEKINNIQELVGMAH